MNEVCKQLGLIANCKDLAVDCKAVYTRCRKYGGGVAMAAQYAVNYILLKTALLLATRVGVEDWLWDRMPMHDSWSAPRTLEEQQILQTRIDALKTAWRAN